MYFRAEKLPSLREFKKSQKNKICLLNFTHKNLYFISFEKEKIRIKKIKFYKKRPHNHSKKRILDGWKNDRN